MISILDIVKNLEDKLNSSLIKKSSENTALDNGSESYKFKLFLDAGDYIGYDYFSDEKGNVDINKRVKYINGLMTVLESNIEGALSQNLTFSTMLELLIPLENASDNTMELVGAIRGVIDEALSLNSYQKIESYNVGVTYSLAGTGQREVRPLIGDSISLFCYVSYSFVAGGVNSTEITMKIDGCDVNSPRMGYSRVANQEADIDSNTTDGCATNVTGSTIFTINFDKPIQKSKLDDIIADFVLNGTNEAHYVEITEPTENGQTTISKYMIFNEANQNTETTLNASTSVTMVEAMMNNGLVKLSSGAQVRLAELAEKQE
ncbi:MAG: hypothetical protein II984_03600 [Clostridia bacterium]|nr:hypothetical protein [Clostridia bacterium]